MVTWKTSYAGVSSFLETAFRDILSAFCSSLASPCFEMVMSPFSIAVEGV